MLSSRSEKDTFKIQILISILTLVLTPLLSGFVVYFQLEKQHDIWEAQRKIIREDRLLQQKIDRINTTGRIITSLIQKARMARTVTNAFTKAHAFPDLYDKRALDKTLPTTLEIAKEYEELEAELLNTILVNGLYFGSDVKKKGNELVSSLYLLKSSLGFEEKAKLVKEEYSKLDNEALNKDLAISNILKKLDKPEDEKTLSKIAIELITKMHKELGLHE